MTSKKAGLKQLDSVPVSLAVDLTGFVAAESAPPLIDRAGDLNFSRPRQMVNQDSLGEIHHLLGHQTMESISFKVRSGRGDTSEQLFTASFNSYSTPCLTTGPNVSKFMVFLQTCDTGNGLEGQGRGRWPSDFYMMGP